MAASISITHLIVRLDTGGAEKSLFRLIRATGEQLDHRVICLGPDSQIAADIARLGVDVACLDYPRAGPLALWRALRLLRRQPPQVLQGWVEPAGPMTFLLVARMLRDKGIVQFAEAAALVRHRYPDWRFVLAGDVDEGNPTSLSEAELRCLEVDFGVEWIGHCDDISGLIARSHVVCLPTFYREGVPKALLEASAAARPMIASDIAGCREVVTDGVTGLLVPTRAVQPLAEAMLRMGEDPEFRQRCGRAARDKAEAVFSVADVVEHTFRVYAELLPE